MAVPFRKTSKLRRNTRRAHQALKPIVLGICSNCNNPILPHRICLHCGFYRGKQRRIVPQKVK